MSSFLTIGERIAALRKKSKHSQATLAEATGKSRSAIAQIESNAMRPDWEFLKDLVRICDSSYEYIFGDVEEMAKKAESKNDLHIKTPSKGVSQSGEKGGKVKGKVSADLENEMHIKAVHSMDMKSEEVRHIANMEYEKRRKRQEEDRKRIMGGFSDVNRAEYGDLQEAFDMTLRQQQMIFRKLLERIEALEGPPGEQSSDQVDTRAAKLPDNEK